MKKIRIVLMAILLFIGIILSTRVYAADVTTTPEGEETKTIEWTDVSNATFSFVHTSNYKEIKDYSIKINGVELIKDVNDLREYYILVSNSAQKPDVDMTNDSARSAGSFMVNYESATTMKQSNISINSYLEKNGDIYVWFYEKASGEVKELISATKVERPEVNPLGSRVTGFFDKNKTTIYENDFLGSYDRTLKIKIGYVTDNQVLKGIKDGTSGSLNNLLNYAKNAQSLYTTSISLTDRTTNSAGILNKFNVTDKSYYYVYFQLDDEQGKYYPMEDIMLYQGVNGSNVKILYNYLDSKFVWNIKDEGDSSTTGGDTTTDTEKPKSDDTTVDTKQPSKDDTAATGKLPQTGVNTVVIISIIGIAIVAAVIGAKKYKKYNIKY